MSATRAAATASGSSSTAPQPEATFPLSFPDRGGRINPSSGRVWEDSFMPRHSRLLTVPLFLAVLALPASAKETKSRLYPEGKFGKGELRYVEGLPLLIVEGTPDEIGEQVGKLAVRHTGQLEKYLKEFLKANRAEKLWPILVKACDALVARMPESHRRELDAMARGAGVDRDVAVVANTMMEVLKLAGCSTLVVEPSRSATGGLLFGRNFDFPALDMLNDLNVITVYRPRGKRAFVA